MTSEAVIVDITDNVGKTVRKGRNSFYSLPKTLSEDDDPFGVFQKPREGKQQAVLEGELLMNSVKETKEPSTGLLVQIETESPRISISESFNSVSSRTSGVGMLGVSGASSVSGVSLNAAGASFGNISWVSSNVTHGSTALSDDVFTQDVNSAEDEPNWDKLLNEAKFMALKISDPAMPSKTPITHSKFNSTAKLRNYSPGDIMDSPSGGLLMDGSKDNPEAFLVQLTPETSPKRRSLTDPGVAASPDLEMKSREKNVFGSNNVKACMKESSNTTGNYEIIEALNKSEEQESATGLEKGKAPENKTELIKIIKSSKENIKPRIVTDSKKAPGVVSSVKPVLKSKLGLKYPASEAKKPLASTVKQPQSETKRVPLSRRPASSVHVTPSRVSEDRSVRGSNNQSAVKTLQFTPNNFAPRALRRESSSAVKAPITKPSPMAHQFKLPSKTTDAHLKKTVAPARTGRLQPTRLSMKPSTASLSVPSSSAASSFIVRPRTGLLKPPSSGGIQLTSATDIPKLNTSGLQRPALYRQGSGLQRPALYRQGSALCQSLITKTTPSRVRRPSDVGLRSAGSAGLPSPQVLNKNSSLVCSTPTVVGPKQSRDSVLPSPITNVKRRM